MPLLRGRSPAWRRDFVVEYLGASELYDGGTPTFQALRSTRWLYVESRNVWRELYDLRRDPYELRNLAGGRDVAALERRLSGRLRRLAR